MTTIEIQVTQEDIDRGVCGKPGKCALALSMTRCIGEPIEVGLFQWHRGTEHNNLPGVAVEFRRTFDYRRSEAKPFTFPVELPGEQG